MNKKLKYCIVTSVIIFVVCYFLAVMFTGCMTIPEMADEIKGLIIGVWLFASFIGCMIIDLNDIK